LEAWKWNQEEETGMTPLAFHIAKQKLLPAKDRTFNDNGGIFDHILQAHCFEVSEVTDLASELKMHMPRCGVDERSTFLPAPTTWMEWRTPEGCSNGILLMADGDDSVVRIDSYGNRGGAVDRHGLTGISFSQKVNISLRYKPTVTGADTEADRRRLVLAELGLDEHTLALLAIINTPRIVGREEHQAHRGLQRELRRKGFQGKVPNWNKIRLEITRAQTESSGKDGEPLTGGKALHFCRSFIRIKRGRLEIVKSHMRGNASNGIKLSHYVVAA
jgi:hypothetical protein